MAASKPKDDDKPNTIKDTMVNTNTNTNDDNDNTHPTLATASKYNQPDYSTPSPTSPSTYMRQIYTSFHRPPFSTKPAEWERLARSKVPAPNFGYVQGSAGTSATYAANIAAFDKYRLRPRMLVNSTNRDLSVELFGTRYASPILVAPVGVQGIMHRDGEEATARACREVGVPMILSTAATRTIEEVARANAGGDRWFQLYWARPQSEEVTVSLLSRAKRSGYKVLVVTLDTFTLGWRPTDLDEAYLPFLWGEGCQIGHSDDVFLGRYEEDRKKQSQGFAEKVRTAWEMIRKPGSIYGAVRMAANLKVLPKSAEWLQVMNSGTYREWGHLKILKELWDGPIVLKGVQTVEDAKLAIEYGVDGIVVSNHGGRQLDGAVASLDALAEIASDYYVQQSGLTLLFDSGIRTGSDVLKALCLGAKAVLVARPYMYGLAIAGQQGVEHVLRCLLAETDISLANMGKKSLKELSRADLQIKKESKL